MSKQDELFLCVTAAKGMKIADVQALGFHQEDGTVHSTIVDGESDDYTWVVKEGASCMIRTRLDRDFFQPSFRAAKRKSLMVEGTVGLQDDLSTDFELELPLQTMRLASYVSKHGIIIAFCILFLLVIVLWAAFVTMASISRARPESLDPDKLLEIEEKRLIEIYKIWHQSKWGKTQFMDVTEDITIVQTIPVTSSDTWSTSSSEEEKVEIEPYEEEEAGVVTSSVYAANVA